MSPDRVGVMLLLSHRQVCARSTLLSVSAGCSTVINRVDLRSRLTWEEATEGGRF